MYVYILYLRGKDATDVILCIGLPSTTTLVDQWLSSLIFHDNMKCITANA